jgi:hypothetical protein
MVDFDRLNPHFSYWRVATDRTFWNGTESWCSFAL